MSAGAWVVVTDCVGVTVCGVDFLELLDVFISAVEGLHFADR